MKKLLLYFITAGVVFAASAGISWIVNPPPLASAMQAESGAEPAAESKDGSHRSTDHRTASPTASGRRADDARVSRIPSLEDTVRLAANLRERLNAVQKRELQLEARQRHLDLVYQDIRLERAALESLRKRVAEELQLIEKKVRVAEEAKKHSKDRKIEEKKPTRGGK
jgi:hypothetical protein